MRKGILFGVIFLFALVIISSGCRKPTAAVEGEGVEKAVEPAAESE